MRNKYSIGLDFGTLSARALLVDVATGQEIVSSSFVYPNGVIDTILPGTEQKLPPDFALQNPHDYQDAVVNLLRNVLLVSGVRAEEIIGIGVDATASTVLALDEDFMPICYNPKYRDNPHSWIKMWKHHSPQDQADRINSVAKHLEEPFLRHCGGKSSAEWYYPKILETIEKAPEVFEATQYFVELGDWIVYLLTGEKKRSSAIASLHAHWDVDRGTPSDIFFESLSPELKKAAAKNSELPIVSLFSRAGTLRKEIADQTGLKEGTAVSMADTDSPVALFSLGITGEETGALILGTSSVLMHLSKKAHYIPGAMASVKDQMMPGYYGNMFGQSAVGDVYDWFVNNAVSYKYYLEAAEKGEAIFDVLNRNVEKLNPATISVYALDWLNGSRSLLQDTNLTGAIVGLTLSTKPEQIYHALVESTAFELKTVIDAIEKVEVPMRQIYACGGISRKSPVIMQMFANILNLPMFTVASTQTVAQGAAILGAVAAGSECGGYDDIGDAVRAMHCEISKCYEPQPELVAVYSNRYMQYKDLYNFFGKDRCDIMHVIKQQC